MSDHLTLDEIERYVRRIGAVDDILAAAEHLEECDTCRDLAAGVVDLENTVEGGERRH